jgi:hypothetical protein
MADPKLAREMPVEKNGEIKMDCFANSIYYGC